MNLKIFYQSVLNNLYGTLFSNDTDEFSVNIYNMLGLNMVIEKKINITSGENTFIIPVSSLSDGLYVISLKSNFSNETYTQKFIKI